jgi:hypothetical protein
VRGGLLTHPAQSRSERLFHRAHVVSLLTRRLRLPEFCNRHELARNNGLLQSNHGSNHGLRARLMDEGENLGPTSSMQIRSVPEQVRKFWNNWAHEAEATLGDVFVKHSLTLMRGGAPTAVATTVPVGWDELCRVIEVSTAYSQARGRPLTWGTKEGKAASRAFDLLNARLQAALSPTMASPAATTVATMVNGHAPQFIGADDAAS